MVNLGATRHRDINGPTSGPDEHFLPGLPGPADARDAAGGLERLAQASVLGAHAAVTRHNDLGSIE
jgi:hypothetical protein